MKNQNDITSQLAVASWGEFKKTNSDLISAYLSSVLKDQENIIVAVKDFKFHISTTDKEIEAASFVCTNLRVIFLEKTKELSSHFEIELNKIKSTAVDLSWTGNRIKIIESGEKQFTIKDLSKEKSTTVAKAIELLVSNSRGNNININEVESLSRPKLKFIELRAQLLRVTLGEIDFEGPDDFDMIEKLSTKLEKDEYLIAAAHSVSVPLVFVCCTQKRMIVFEKRLLSSGDREVALDKIDSIKIETGTWDLKYTHKISVWECGGSLASVVLNKVKGEYANQFVTRVREVLRSKSETKQTNARPAGVSSVADELLKLADLKNKGILTEQEFLLEKKKLINS